MSFLNSYKRLDNLCKDLLSSDVGLTTYIDEMKAIGNGSFLVKGWDFDLKKLKHYRHIRNMIVHENDVYEDDTCSEEDITWIENFHYRILNQSDPLAIYQKATKKQDKIVSLQNAINERIYGNYYINSTQKRSSSFIIKAILLITLSIIFIFVLLKFFSF